jgi:hypothetical protein
MSRAFEFKRSLLGEVKEVDAMIAAKSALIERLRGLSVDSPEFDEVLKAVTKAEDQLTTRLHVFFGFVRAAVTR